MPKVISSLLFILFAIQVFAQESSETSSEGERGFYRKEIYGGGSLHSNGISGHFRYSKRINGYLKLFYAGEIATMKHPKELKISNSNFDNNRGFVYGKQHSLTMFRPQIGLNKIWYTKDRQKGVQVGYLMAVGPTLGFEKPVYLEIRSNDIRSRAPRIEVFDPARHDIGNIQGKAPGLTGIEETKLIPGASAKFALQFEYSAEDDYIRGIEVGVNVDALARKPQILALNDNQQIFVTAFISIQFGRKYLE